MKFLRPTWPAPQNIHAAITTKQGWSSHHLNRPVSHAELMQGNDTLMQLLDLPATPNWLQQFHSNQVANLPTQTFPNADASITTATNTICIVTTADCMPLLVCDQAGTQVAAIHAGWRGLANNIIENTLQQFNAPARELLVWMGPTISVNHFEVGDDVYLAFTAQHDEAKRAFHPKPNGKWMADLYALARLRLQTFGVNNVYGGNLCTYDQAELFYSYRRDQGKTGHIASLIWKN